MDNNRNFSRRNFLTNAAMGTIAAMGTTAFLSSCNRGKTGTLNLPPLLDAAPDGKLLKAGLIGCGGRGTGAALDFLHAGPNLEIVAIGDLFADRIAACREKLLAEKNVMIPDDKCFTGFDNYQKVIDAGVDLVIIATPPFFRPAYFEAAIKARKHVFMEKPVAVDPVGARSIMVNAKKAESMGLTVICGTQRRHQRDYVATYAQVREGMIGEITGANAYWNQSQLWYRNRQAEWSDMEFMIRDWVNWSWLSGDHIVEQHVHNIDVVNWFTGMHPSKAVGFGARHQRVTGDQFDMFSIDFEFENQTRMHSMCRQIDNCSNNVSEFIMGTHGYTNCANTIWDRKGNVVWKFDYGKDEQGNPLERVKVSPYRQEHIDMVTAIRTNKPIVEAEECAISTLTGIMGRISAYTGKEVTWEEMMNSNLELKPTSLELGPQEMNRFTVPVPGKV